MTTRRELIEAVAARYRAAGRRQKKEILDEFVKVTGFHRKHAIRILKESVELETPEPRQRARIYNETVGEALHMVWEAADRICGKRLRRVAASLVEAMERHGHLKLDAGVRERLLSMSAATMDRLLTEVRERAKQGRRRTMINTPLRKSIAVRTFGDWHNPCPGVFEMDMVLHCGKSTVFSNNGGGNPQALSSIRSMVTGGAITSYTIPTVGAGAVGVALGDDNNIWFTEFSTSKIGRMTPNGVFTEWDTPTPNSYPYGITTGPDGALWFVESYYTNKVGRITAAGVITEFVVPTTSSTLLQYITSADGALWFTDAGDGYF